MNFIIEFFQDCATLIGTLIDFIVLLFRDLLQLILILPKSVVYITSAVGHLPPLLLPFATLTIAIAILFLILGRGHSGGGND